MKFFAVIWPLISTERRREVLTAVTVASMLVQLSSMPVALSIPTLAKQFNTSISEVAWIVIIYLLMLGSLVLIAARLGDRFGHNKVFFWGILLSTVASTSMAISQNLLHLIVSRGFAGVGSAMIMGNAHALLAAEFSPDERGRAFSVPVIGARFGTLMGLAGFGLLLHFFSWRWVFVSFIPMGLLCIFVTMPLLGHKKKPASPDLSNQTDWPGVILLVITVAVLILSGTHLHEGEESFVSPEGLNYHVPLHILFLILLGIFVMVERKVCSPLVDMRHFQHKNFSMALGSNIFFHFSMLFTFMLVPILVEEGFGKSPMFVTVVMLPSQMLGLFMPFIAGWIYDRYQPRLLRPGAMMLIAGGFLLIGLSVTHVSVWIMPILLVPISIGTNMFNPINNATVMNSLLVKHRGIASGMLETTRELGHAFGATAAAAALALAVPSTINLLSEGSSQKFFLQGFQTASIVVVFTLMIGAILAFSHKPSTLPGSGVEIPE